MKNPKIVFAFALLLIGLFSFSKHENPTPKTALNLEEVNVIKMLSKQEFECRPSSEVAFYVETELVKKSRGFSTINASIFVFDRVSGQSSLLTTDKIIIPSYKDAILDYDLVENNSKKTKLINGDTLITNNKNTSYTFKDLIKYETIYNSYIRSTNKLLDMNRTI